MEITINYYGQAVSVSVEVYEFLAQADRKAENLAHEQRRHWDGRECDEYIIAAEGRLPYCATPEELICQRETLDEILTVLALCTPTQRERFLLYALDGFIRPKTCTLSWKSSGNLKRRYQRLPKAQNTGAAAPAGAKRKLTRAEKKEIAAIIQRAKGDGKPHTAQQTIPYLQMYPDGTAAEIVEILKECAHKMGKCVVVVTHSNDFAKQVDVVLRLKKGELHVEER